MQHKILRTIKGRKADPPPANCPYSVFLSGELLAGLCECGPQRTAHLSAVTLHSQVTLHTAGAAAPNTSSKPAESFPLALRGAGPGSRGYTFKVFRGRKTCLGV